MKELLSISEVFGKIKDTHGRKSFVTLASGQKVHLSHNLIWLRKKRDLTCSVCGCNGTHLQRFSVANREIWRVMTYSVAAGRQSFLNLDHVVPQSRGGEWVDDNIRVTCEFCNNARSDDPIVKESGEGEKIFTLGMIVDIINSRLHGKVRNLKSRIVSFKNLMRKRLRDVGARVKRIFESQLYQVLPDALSVVGIRLDDELKSAISAVGV